MNKVYKVLFNKSIGKYVVVSENSKSAKKSSKSIQSIVLAVVAFGGTSITIAATLQLGGGTATGTDTIAIGERANATKANGIAIGSTALASEINAIAMGFNSNSSGENSTAIGNSSVASKQGSIALGQNTESSGADSVAIGSVAKATADNTVALGARSNALSINSIAVGTGTTSSGEDTISVGTNAAASDKNTIALGVNSKSSAENATAFGLNAAAAGADSLAFGTNAAASVKNTIALGLNSKSSAENATALGLGANASAKDTISIGTNAKTSDVNAIALGINSKSLSGNAVAIGLRSEAAGADSLAFGSAARTSDVNSIALGNQAAASKANTIALGTQTKAAGANAIALGNQADASVFQSIALGTSAKASAADTVALGTGSIASGNSAIALGNKAQALGSNSISIGKGNIVSGKNSAAIGDPSNISGNNSYSLGNNNTIATDNTFVVGSGVTVNTAANTVNGNVILGNLSADKAYVQVSNGTINGKTYNYAGTAAGVVSVGAIGAERQIVNVAPGAITATSTDAINGSQLYATNAVVGQVADDAAKALGTTINPATGGINAPTYITNNPVTGAPTTSNNVGDAIKNLNAAVNSPLTFTDAATGSSTNPLGSRFKIEGDQNITTVVSQGQAKIQLNPDLKGINSITLGNTVLNPNGLTVGGPTGPSITTNGINAGDKAITNVAPGVNGTDAVNVDQLKAQETTLGNKGLNFSANSGAAVHKNLGDTLGVIGTGTKADSEYSGENVKTITDANGNIVVQLDKNLTADSLTINGKPGVNGQPGTPGLSITGAQGPAGVNGQPGEVTTRIEYNDGTGPQQVANLNDGLKFTGNQGSTINKKLNETLSIKGDLANADAATATNLRVDEENGELKIKLARNLTDLDSVTVGNTVLNPNGLTVGGPTGPSITTNGINAGDKAITNVAPGVNGTDAVNVDQLTKQTAVATTEVKAADGDKNVSVEKVTAKDGHSIYNVGVSRDLNVDTVTLPNVDGSSTKLSANGLSFVDIDGNPTGPMVTANGIDAGNQKITNVAPAIISKESKDAVNGSQLYNLGNNINNIFGGNASYNGDIINWTNIGGTGHNNIDDAIKSIGDQATNANKGWNIATDNGVTSNVKPNDTVNINGDKTSGIIISNVGNNITVGLADKVNIGDKIKIDGNKGTVNNLTNTTWNGPDQIISGQAATEDQLAQAVKNVTNQTTAAKTEVTQGENIVVTSSKASDGHTIYNVETAKDVKFNSVKSDVVQVGNVQIDKDGINAGNQKVTNVEAGTISKESKDAVNGSQLYQSNQNIANYLGGGSNIDANGNTTAPTYNVNGGSYNNVGDALGAIDNRVTNVQNNLEQAFNYTNKRIEDVENNANAGTAQALATAGLPQAYIPGKSMMAISGGTFRGESGYAIGFSSISDNGRWVIKATGSGNSRGDFGGTVGGGIQW